MNKEAQAIADWVMRVLDEAEPPTTAIKLDMGRRAYDMARLGVNKGKILAAITDALYGPVRATNTPPFRFTNGEPEYVNGIT